MTLTIRCDHIGTDFVRCDSEVSGIAFDSYPAWWTVAVLNRDGDHMDYCDEHRPVPAPLPKKDNGYPVVARCVNCQASLTLWPDFRGWVYLAHVYNLKESCAVQRKYAEADREVPELGLLDKSNLSRKK